MNSNICSQSIQHMLYKIFIVLFFLSLMSCVSDNDTVAQKKIKQYLLENKNEGDNIKVEEFSKLYIIDPKDESNMPKPEKNSVEDGVNELILRSGGLLLALEGCSSKALKQIIENDRKFEKWKTGGKGYVIICFFSITDKYLNETKSGLCFRLDSALNVYKSYQLSNVEEISNILKNK